MKERGVSMQDTIRQEFMRLAPKLVLFAEVVEAGSITRAAGRLGVGKSMVSKSLAGLESKLGVLLLERTTRVQKLTAVGDQLYHSVGKMLAEGELALTEIGGWKEKPSGKLRLTIAELACQCMATTIAAFRSDYPLVEMDIIIDDACLDLGANQLDLGVRFGWPKAQNLIVRQLCKRTMVLVAGSAYLERSKSIGKPADLAHHDWVVHSADPVIFGGMPLKGPNNVEAKLQVRCTVTTNSALLIKNLVLEGMGIAVYPQQNIEHELASGALIRLLPEWRLPAPSVYVAYTHRDALSRVARLFLDRVLADFRSEKTRPTNAE